MLMPDPAKAALALDALRFCAKLLGLLSVVFKLLDEDDMFTERSGMKKALVILATFGLTIIVHLLTHI